MPSQIPRLRDLIFWMNGGDDHSISGHWHLPRQSNILGGKVFQKASMIKKIVLKLFFSFLCRFYITANNLKILGPRRRFRLKAEFILSASSVEWSLYKSTVSPIPGSPGGEPASAESELFKCKVGCFFSPCLLSESRQHKVLKMQPWIVTRAFVRAEYGLGSRPRSLFKPKPQETGDQFI